MDRDTAIIIGLGNPGCEYTDTRHNVGFMLVNRIAGAWNIRLGKKKLEGELGEGTYEGKRIILVKPRTFMNLSGFCVSAVLNFYKAAPDTMIVICDDFSLPLGQVRIRRSGSSGGQKGLASIISQVGTDAFARLRVGIGHLQQGQEPVHHVLGKFSAREREIIEEALSRSERALSIYLREGIDRAMSYCNTKPAAAGQEDPKTLPPAAGVEEGGS